MFWSKLNSHKIKLHVFEALSKNANYRSEDILGLPGTFLDTEVFYDDAAFLKEAPFLSALVANPNHIGCHTLTGDHEEMFSGTQEIEKELIRICAEEIFKAEPFSIDGYVASGGTEANIEALWIYRNYFITEFNAKHHEIAVVFSEDTHYSLAKGCDLLNLEPIMLKVNDHKRSIEISDLENKIDRALEQGKKYFIVVLNMGTTMFGSVDDIEQITSYFNILKLNYKLHIDAAYGGFIYPFTNSSSQFDFANQNVSSVSIDGHKLLQAPYGTGIFLIRKNLMQYVCTEKASYVKGKDYTLCGSRSGANAVCVWMILHAHGSNGWTLKMNHFLDTTSDVCAALDEMKVKYFRNPFMNIITIKSGYISNELANRYYLIPDSHENPQWYKMVIMSHVKQGVLDRFLSDLAKENAKNK